MKKSFQERIIELMSEKSITQSEISKLTGITQSSLSDYIKGKYQPKQDKIDLIAQALKVSPAYLMGWEDDSNQNQYEIKTIAAHHDDYDFTEEELEEIEQFKEFIKMRKRQKEEENKK